jgi:hypothetical protein
MDLLGSVGMEILVLGECSERGKRRLTEDPRFSGSAKSLRSRV